MDLVKFRRDCGEGSDEELYPMIIFLLLLLIWVPSVIGSVIIWMAWNKKEPFLPYPKVTAPPNDYYDFIIR